jgi:hypothetical protein
VWGCFSRPIRDGGSQNPNFDTCTCNALGILFSNFCLFVYLFMCVKYYNILMYLRKAADFHLPNFWISESVEPCNAKSVALPIRKLCLPKWPCIGTDLIALWRTELNWYLVNGLVSWWTKQQWFARVWGLICLKSKVDLTWHRGECLCLWIIRVVLLPDWSVLECGMVSFKYGLFGWVCTCWFCL